MKFIKCNLVESIFRGAEVRYISVIFSNATLSDFTYANLYKGTIKASIFTLASFVSSKIQGTEFHYTDLSNANLLNAKCFDDVCSLDEALSIYNATLPNGTLGPFNNLIRNGDVQCNLSVEEHGWIVEEKDSIIIKPSTNNSGKCVFTSSSNFTRPSMSLTVNLSRFIELISTGLAVAMVQSRHSDSLNIDITTDDLKYSFLRPLTSGVDYNTFTDIFLLPIKTKNLIITIEFRPHHYPDLFPLWFDYIQLTIDLCLNKLWYSCPDNPSSFLN
jgi:hypothetical protein